MPIEFIPKAGACLVSKNVLSGLGDVRIRTGETDALHVTFLPPSQADATITEWGIRVRQRLTRHG